MAQIKERKGVWQADFWANGKRVRKTTGIIVGESRQEQRENQKMAQQIADNMERLAKGAPVDKVLDAVRAVAEMQGSATRIPSTREFLNSIPATTSESSEKKPPTFL